MIKNKLLSMINYYTKDILYAKNMVLPKYNHEIHHEYGIGPMNGWDSLDWFPIDTEDRFDKNWSNPTKRILLEKLGWTKTSIKYNSNRQGFRMDVDLNEIRPEIYDFYLGCSMTFGIGVNVDDTWPSQMSKKMNRPGLNFGVPGGSIETQYRLLRCWAPILKPKRVYTLGTYLGRREFLEDNHPTFLGNPKGNWRTFVDNPKHELYWQSEIQISHIRAYDAMRAVCIDYNIELYSIRDDKRYLFEHLSGYGEGRDLTHSGPIWHLQVSQLTDDCWERLA